MGLFQLKAGKLCCIPQTRRSQKKTPADCSIQSHKKMKCCIRDTTFPFRLVFFFASEKIYICTMFFLGGFDTDTNVQLQHIKTFQNTVFQCSCCVQHCLFCLFFWGGCFVSLLLLSSPFTFTVLTRQWSEVHQNYRKLIKKNYSGNQECPNFVLNQIINLEISKGLI